MTAKFPDIAPRLPAAEGHDWPEFRPGWVWLTGAGPGDPGLLTLNALHGLREADVVVHDALVDPRILSWARPGARLIHSGKRGGKASPKQRDITLHLVELARAGNRVLRLKGGDPFVFGRGGEEALGLVEAGIPFRVVPGISSGVGGLAHAGIPVTHRDVNQSVTFVTGHDKRGLAPVTVDWEAVAKASPVVVIYMGMKHLGEIAAAMIAAGRAGSEPVAIVTDASLPTQRVLETSLATAAADAEAAGMQPPALIVVGRNVLLRQALDWAGQMAGEPPRSLDPLGTRAQDDAAEG